MKLKAKSDNANSMFFKFESVGDCAEGEFVEYQKNVPSRFGDETILTLRGKRGPLVIRCTSKLEQIIDDNLAEFVKDAHVKITFTREVPTTKGNPMKDYDVELDAPAAKASVADDALF